MLVAFAVIVAVACAAACDSTQSTCPAKEVWSPPNDDLFSRIPPFASNYTSVQGIGLRARQHFFPSQKDVDDIFRNNLSELEQAYLWHINNLRGLVDA